MCFFVKQLIQLKRFQTILIVLTSQKNNDKIEQFSCSHDFYENIIRMISNDLREIKNKQSHFRNLCNAGLHGNAQA